MSIQLETNQKAAFQEKILAIWHEAHGGNAGKISSSWGEDRVVIMIEEALFKIEHLLAQSTQGSQVVEEYVRQILIAGINEEKEALEKILNNSIESVTVNAALNESYIMLIFKL